MKRILVVFASVLLLAVVFSGVMYAASFNLGRGGKLDVELAVGGAVFLPPGQIDYTTYIELLAKYSVPIVRFVSFNTDFGVKLNNFHVKEDASGEIDLYILFKPEQWFTIKSGIRNDSLWDRPIGSIQEFYKTGQTYAEVRWVVW